LIRFAGFELDRARSELRRADGTVHKLRPKTLEMLNLFVENPGRVLSKQELMEAVWPNVHVGEDSLFQCIKELRGALGDEHRQVIRLVSGQGYVFYLEPVETPAAEPSVEAAASPDALRATPVRRFGRQAQLALGLLVAVLLGSAGTALVLGLRPGPSPATIMVMPFAAAGADGEATAISAGVTTGLADGLARITNIRVASSPANAPVPATDYVVTGELRRDATGWSVEARMVDARTHEVQLVISSTVAADAGDPGLQQSRLAAGVGHELAVKLNLLLNGGDSVSAGTKVVIDQATAFLTRTSPERFGEAESMLKDAIEADPDNTDLAVALAALQLRGIQMVWYPPDAAKAAEASARSTLERALQRRPDSIPVLEAYCRFLNATTRFTESLVACGRALGLDPWNGIALYHVGLGQLQLGRFEDALASFELADRYDTPAVARWTWLVGAGWANLLLDRDEAAVGWLERSVAITPASGRPLMLLAAARQRLGQQKEAEAALQKALTLRPGSTAQNITPPTTGTSPVYLAASARIIAAMAAAGLPEH
jgi:DNA-binding winged helix-turn-helix (wHTH) protein/tetratricopeptide (TPR) repeat protein